MRPIADAEGSPDHRLIDRQQRLSARLYELLKFALKLLRDLDVGALEYGRCLQHIELFIGDITSIYTDGQIAVPHGPYRTTGNTARGGRRKCASVHESIAHTRSEERRVGKTGR